MKRITFTLQKYKQNSFCNVVVYIQP